MKLWQLWQLNFDCATLSGTFTTEEKALTAQALVYKLNKSELTLVEVEADEIEIDEYVKGKFIKTELVKF